MMLRTSQESSWNEWQFSKEDQEGKSKGSYHDLK